MSSIRCLGDIKENIKKVIVGKDEVIDLMLVSLICSGHVLIEDLPGLGKTTLVSALASSLGCDFQRIQFTPDVLPSDITGFNIYQFENSKQKFVKGSIHNQIILADEINRASPKTQSALLEAMQERQVTVDGTTYPLPKPFMVLATQNPVDMAGTYPLPEAQMDRFLMQITMGYPTFKEEMDIVNSHRSVTEVKEIGAVACAADILKVQELLPKVNVDEAIVKYIVEIVTATRSFEGVLTGVSPRGSIFLTQAACAMAILEGRSYVLPDDVKRLAPYVLAHRMIMKNRSGAKGTTALDAIDKILKTVKVPKVKG
ncbi:MAG: MoxR family ATPase [Clostridia bacterium]|nr:MoxR family ATPase [Clostridia bacterium]